MLGLKRLFPPFKFRPGRPEDAEALLQVHQRAVLVLGRRIYSDAQVESWACGDTAERFAEAMLEDNEVFEVAVARKGRIIAFCSRKDAEVRSLYVDPDWTRHGIGRLLLQRAETAIIEAGFDSISVGASLVGMPFYESQGYRVLRHRHWKTRGGLFIPAAEMEKHVYASRNRQSEN